MPTLYLIDGYAQFFRAYHAIRTPMTSPVTKEPTNMSFGFMGMMLKLLRGEGKIGGPPEYVACVIDVSGDKETFRSELYPDYKAHRPPPPEDLFVQVDRCLAALREIGVPVLGAEGFEADDVIATLVTRLRKEHPDLRVRIISKDKDLKQLLEPNGVELYDIHTDEVIDVEKLKEETGITPAQVIDYLALMGDSADNVPGVDGVGPKTAAELIATYGTLEGVLAEVAKEKPAIKGKRLENIRAAAEKLGLSKTLVTLRHDAPAEMPLETARVGTLKLDKLVPILKELGFNRYQDEVKKLVGGAGATASASAESASAPRGEKARVDDGREANPPLPLPRGGVKADSPVVKKAKRVAEATMGLFDAAPSTASLDAGAGTATPAVGLPAHATHNEQYRCVRTRRQLDELVAELSGAEIIALDTETTGLSPMDCQLCGLSFSTRAGTGWYVPVRSPNASEHLSEREVLDALRPVLEDSGRVKCGHNIKFDLLVLRVAGIELAGVLHGSDPSPREGQGVGSGSSAESSISRTLVPHLPAPSVVYDSMVASFLIDSSRSSHSLDALALALLNHTNISIKDLIGSGKDQRTFDTVPLDLATQYAAEDADVALQLCQIMLPQLRAMGLWELFTRVEMPLVRVLADLEFNGILVDGVELDKQRDRLSGQITELSRQIDEAAKLAIGRTFNPDSPKQLAQALFGKPDGEPGSEGLGLKPVKRTQTGFSTDIEVLEKLAEDPAITTPIPKLILEYRQLTKLVSTYLVALKEAINARTHRIHASFNQTVAVTGRLASSDPNLQNIPIRTELGRDIRKAFIAPSGRVLISADYSQIELRLLAHLSDDPALIKAFEEDQDIHAAVAAQIHNVPLEKVSKEQRSGAKMVNFGIVYGITAFGLARRLGVSNSEADEIITGYKKRFAGITTFLQECVEQAERQGYVETLLKRRRPIPDIESNIPTRRAFAERTAINSVVQGSAADLIKLAMIEIEASLPLPEGGVGEGSASQSAKQQSSKAAHERQSKRAPAVDLSGVRMLLQIHDELVFEAPAQAAEPAMKWIVDRMQSAMRLKVPLKVDAGIGQTWFDE